MGACDGCSTEEECRRCIINQTAPIMDHMLGPEGESGGELAELESLVELAGTKGLLAHDGMGGKIRAARTLLEEVRRDLYGQLGDAS